MSLVFNEAALNFLLESPDGPVGRDLRRRSENITALVRAEASMILEQMPPSLIDFDIVNGDDGLASIIGMQSGGRYDSYLAAKQLREGKPFSGPLEQGLHT